MANRRRLWVLASILGGALLALFLYAAEKRSSAKGSSWNPDTATDEELVDAFMRSVGAVEAQSSWHLRKWEAPVRIVRVPKLPDPRLLEDHVPLALASVLDDITRATPGLVNVIDKTPSCPADERVVLLDDSIWEIGTLRDLDIFYTPPAAERAECFSWPARNIDPPPLMMTHAGTTQLRVDGDEITGAMIGIGYSWTIQYHRYDLAEDILRKNGLSPSDIASALPILTDSEILERAQSQPMIDNPTPRQQSEQKLAAEDPADRVVREKELGFGEDWLNRCYGLDFEDHAYSVVASALSQSLGIDWGARVDPADLAAGKNGRRPNIELVKQTYRGPDYWLLRRYWLLFVSVLYAPEVKRGMSASELGPIAERLIARHRNDPKYKANVTRQPCIDLPPF